ncbi:MAG: hypothetical protein AAFX10_08095, partial [Pseudomonadota bacterium]
PQEGLEAMVIIIPGMLMLGAHVLLGQPHGYFAADSNPICTGGGACLCAGHPSPICRAPDGTFLNLS